MSFCAQSDTWFYKFRMQVHLLVFNTGVNVIARTGCAFSAAAEPVASIFHSNWCTAEGDHCCQEIQFLAL